MTKEFSSSESYGEKKLKNETQFSHTYPELVKALAGEMRLDKKALFPSEGSKFDYQSLASWLGAFNLKKKAPNILGRMYTDNRDNRKEVKIDMADEESLTPQAKLLKEIALTAAKLECLELKKMQVLEGDMEGKVIDPKAIKETTVLEIMEDVDPAIMAQVKEYKEILAKAWEETLNGKMEKFSFEDVMEVLLSKRMVSVAGAVIVIVLWAAACNGPVGENKTPTTEGNITSTPPIVETTGVDATNTPTEIVTETEVVPTEEFAFNVGNPPEQLKDCLVIDSSQVERYIEQINLVEDAFIKNNPKDEVILRYGTGKTAYVEPYSRTLYYTNKNVDTGGDGSAIVDCVNVRMPNGEIVNLLTMRMGNVLVHLANFEFIPVSVAKQYDIDNGNGRYMDDYLKKYKIDLKYPMFVDKVKGLNEQYLGFVVYDVTSDLRSIVVDDDAYTNFFEIDKQIKDEGYKILDKMLKGKESVTAEEIIKMRNTVYLLRNLSLSKY